MSDRFVSYPIPIFLRAAEASVVEDPCRCEGGWTIRAWEYLVKHGVCTGGHYRQKGVCKPYAFHQCGYHPGRTYFGDCPKHTWPTPRCEKFCRRGYPIPYQKDKFWGNSSYVLPKDEKAIQRDLMRYGPQVASYIVYEDFRYYRGGIYEVRKEARKQ
ncbi:papain family cysteine protease, partial [Ancylostoma caninum]